MTLIGKCNLISTQFSSLKQGTVGFENQINRCLELAEYLYTKIKNREEFEMVFDGEVGCCQWTTRVLPDKPRGGGGFQKLR